MVYRTLLKQNDGDLVPWGQSLNKPRDNAQKWRTIKLYLRFFKNPFGFIQWRLYALRKRGRYSILHVF